MAIAVNQYARDVLDALTSGLTSSQPARTLNSRPGTFMAVHVELIWPHRFSVAHYGEQNGDLMRDPEMVFYRDESGDYFASYWRNDYAHVEQESLVIVNGHVASVNDRVQRDHTRFANTWMRNIVEQQGLDIKRRAK